MQAYNRKRISFWNQIYRSPKPFHRFASPYHRLLQRCYQFRIPAGSRILELGCGEGHLLASLNPSFGVGIDFSKSAISKAKDQHPALCLIQADAHFLPLQTKFDVIILSDLINDLWDVQKVLQILSKNSHSRTRIIINSYSRLWQIPLNWAEQFGFKKRTLPQNWFTTDDIRNLLNLADYEQIKLEREILLPGEIFFISWFLNNILVRVWPFKLFALTNFVVARSLKPGHHVRPPNPSVSIIIPARNEAGNIANLFKQMPTFEGKKELIFIEGHSKDETLKRIEDEMVKRPEEELILLKQNGVGKADAVWQGFEAATNELLIILDADLSVQPHELVRFYKAAASNKGEFINGSRLVYPMRDKAMQFGNLITNRIFGLIYSWLLNQPVKDTLCGTKAIWKEDFLLLKKEWPIGKFDPFGDFDLLLGATKLNLKIVDIPIRYHERTYGKTNISRWNHGLMLVKVTLAAARQKFYF